MKSRPTDKNQSIDIIVIDVTVTKLKLLSKEKPRSILILVMALPTNQLICIFISLPKYANLGIKIIKRFWVKICKLQEL